jgi:AcrR family transcriptional regulator
VAGYSERVTEVADRARDRVARRQVDKFAERRDQLAAVALQTLAQLGYARTSLRDIAQNSEFSHGVLHYYFTDKVDLITHCVRLAKAECVTRYDHVVATAASADELRDGFAAALAATLREDESMHRLWYDLRNQTLFDASFRGDVQEIDASLEQMIWRVVSRYAELAAAPLAVSPAIAYGLFDGLFQHALIQQAADPGRPAAADALRANAAQVLASLITVR